MKETQKRKRKRKKKKTKENPEEDSYPVNSLHSRLRSHFPKTQPVRGCKIRVCVNDEESRSRLFRSSCSRHSLEIASGHYGRLLTASPPTTTSSVPLSSTTVPFAAASPCSLYPGPLSPTFSNLPPLRPGSSCGMQCTPVASSSARSPLTSTCADRQVHTRHTTAVERSPTRRGIQRARWASCRRCWNPEARPQASATRAVVSDVPASLIGTVERKWRYPVSAIRVPRTGFHDAP